MDKIDINSNEAKKREKKMMAARRNEKTKQQQQQPSREREKKFFFENISVTLAREFLSFHRTLRTEEKGAKILYIVL